MRKLLIGAAAAGALAITTGTALALSAQDDAGQPTSLASPTTSSSTSSSPTSSTSSSPTSSTSSSPTSSTSSSTDTPTSGAARLTAEDASRIVQARMGGQVHEVEREEEHGRLEWKVEITASDGRTYDVRIDAETGAVTRTDVDDDHHGGKDDHDDD